MSEIKALKRVSAYRTSDGVLHDTRIEAERHQGSLNLTAWLRENLKGLLTEDDAEVACHRMVTDASKVIDMLEAATKRGKEPDLLDQGEPEAGQEAA
jgi:hypothetical protein